MYYKEKTLEKLFAILLSFLLVFNPMVAPFVWSMEEEPPAEEPVVEVEVIDEEPEGDSTITTGDADSLTEVDTTANTNVDCVPGEMTDPEDPCVPPEGETDCPDGVEISNDNLADVADTATSSATTGKNAITGATGDALIDTGNATAGASLENKVNTNVVVFEEGDEVDELGQTEESTEAGELTEEASGKEGPKIIIKNENEGTLTNDADVLAGTGENQANGNQGDATIETGDALAYANLLNLLNSNIVGSDFEIFLLNLLEGQEGDININEIWKEIIESGQLDGLNLNGEDLTLFMVQNYNLADLENDVDVVATSGTNQANKNEGDATIHTGDATALANVINFVNVNLIGSQFFLGVINIFGSYLGDLILPRPEYFINNAGNGGSNSDSGAVVFENQNQAEVQDQVQAGAETGANEEINNQGDNLIETGDAQAAANIFSLVNLNILRNNWFFLIINNLGSWMGLIFGWSAPDAVEENGEGGPVIYQLGFDSENGTDNQGSSLGAQSENGSQSVVKNQNQAVVKNNIQTQASTGQNQANGNQGNTEIITGNARSLANLFNFINLNIWGSRWFLAVVNILGDWSGNTIFAYPDVAVTLTNGFDQVMVGETTDYTLSYQNQGYDEANNVWVGFELPQGTSFLGDSSGLTPTVSDHTYSWFIGALGVGEGGSFAIQVQIDPDFSFEEPLSFWSKIIPQAQAAENGKEGEVVANASIGTADPESDLSNNTASAKTLVYLLLPGEEDEEGGVDQRQPILEITAWNNVGDFVYPGDTVSFVITISNTSDVPSNETYLLQELFNGLPEEGFGTAEFEIGTLESGKTARLSFGLALADNGFLPGGPYHTLAQAFGKAPNSNEVSSNQARTDFQVRLKELSSLFEARALEEEKGEILGTCQPSEEILPYVLLFLLSSFWLLDKSKKMFKIEAQS